MTEYFDMNEAAKKMKISIRTLRKLVKKEKLKIFKIGGNGKQVTTQEEIDRCVKGNQHRCE